MSKKRTLCDVFRKAMAESGLSLYRIAKDTGLSPQSLLRFRRGDHSLQLRKADVLADYLGLELLRKRNR
jgi:transcriptional regulator with XRE-family HTH domain